MAEAAEAKCPSPSYVSGHVLEIEEHVSDSPSEVNVHSSSECKVNDACDSNIQVPGEGTVCSSSQSRNKLGESGCDFNCRPLSEASQNGKAMVDSPVEHNGQSPDASEVTNHLGEGTIFSNTQPSDRIGCTGIEPASEMSHGILEVEKLVSDSLVEGNVVPCAASEVGIAHEENIQDSADETGSCVKDTLAEPTSDVKAFSPSDVHCNVELKNPILTSPVEVNYQSSTKDEGDDACKVDDMVASVEPFFNEISAQNITDEVDRDQKLVHVSPFDGTDESAIQSNSNLHSQSTFVMEGKSHVALEVASSENDCEENQLKASAESSGTDECQGKAGSICV